MLKKKKLFLLIIVILVLPVLIMYAELTDISVSEVIITIDIPHNENINMINFSFDITSPTSAFIVKTIDDDPSAGVLTLSSGSVDTWESEDEKGFLISYAKSSNTYTFTVQKKPNYTPRGNINTEGPQLSLYISNLSGTYSITSPATGTCYDIDNDFIPTTPEVVYSFCVPVANIEYIQLENGNTVTAAELTSIHTTTDDSVNIYANAYDSSNAFLGPVYVDWKFSNLTFDDDDIDPDFGEATEFSPDNTGASNISIEYKYDFETDKVLSNSYSVTAAGEFSSLKIVDSNKDEITTETYALSSPPTDDIVLYAAEFDSSNVFRKYVSAFWTVKDLDNNSVIATDIIDSAIGENVTLSPVCEQANPAAGDYIITARHNTVDNCTDTDYCDSTSTITISPKATVDTYIIKMHDIDNDEYIDVPASFEPGTSAIELSVFGYDDCGNPKGLQNINWCIKTQNFSDGALGSFTGNVLTAAGNSVIYLPPVNESGTAVIEVRTDSCGAITARADSVEITTSSPPPVPSGIRIFTSLGSNDFIIDEFFTAATGSAIGLWAGTVDADGEYIQDIVVTWSTPSLWTQHNPLSPVPSETADFIHNNAPGYSEILITHSDFSSYTGKITVLPDQPASPYNVVHVLDRSGSMRQKAYAETGSPSKMDTVKDAADYFVNLMQADSSNGYGLVVFDDQSDTLVPSAGIQIQDLTLGI